MKKSIFISLLFCLFQSCKVDYIISEPILHFNNANISDGALLGTSSIKISKAKVYKISKNRYYLKPGEISDETNVPIQFTNLLIADSKGVVRTNRKLRFTKATLNLMIKVRKSERLFFYLEGFQLKEIELRDKKLFKKNQ